MSQDSYRSFATRVIHDGFDPERFGQSISTPIYQTSTFMFNSAEEGAEMFEGKRSGYYYTRLGNPTIEDLERKMALLEGGTGAVATASGMAAANIILSGFLSSGSHIVASKFIFGPTRNYIEQELSRFGIESDFVDTSSITAIDAAIKNTTRLLFVETPANPSIMISDIRRCAGIATKHGIILVVDSTFATPAVQRPLELGADIVMHSMTKAINGHTDLVGGIIIARKEDHVQRLRKMMQMTGCCIDPHQAWLVLRGLKTLALRMEKAQANALKISQWLENHPKISSVSYPGLESHPGHELAKNQMHGFGSMIAFEVKGEFEAAKKVVNSVKLCLLAVSLGSIETLIQHPASMTHSVLSKEKREAAGVTDGMIRFSTGCEDADDLIRDLEQALEKV